MAGTGLKKCVPMTRCGLSVAAAMAVIDVYLFVRFRKAGWL